MPANVFFDSRRHNTVTAMKIGIHVFAYAIIGLRCLKKDVNAGLGRHDDCIAGHRFGRLV
jgi:hypothetical protein